MRYLECPRRFQSRYGTLDEAEWAAAWVEMRAMKPVEMIEHALDG